MIGKLPPEALAEQILDRTGVDDVSVQQGPAYGEDTAAIDLDGRTLVVNADPLSLAADRIGTLAPHIVCNDVAASGAQPRWLTNTMFLPADSPETVDAITTQLDEAARRLEVSIVGGHAEYLPALERPLLSLTAMGVTDRYVPTGGASPGDRVLLVGPAGLEGTAILATDFREELSAGGVDDETIDRAAGFIDEISVVPDALAMAEVATGMHDPTEGGILAGLVELAGANELGLRVRRADIPIRAETGELAAVMDIDPLCTFGSGALLATVPPERVDRPLGERVGSEITEIGVVTEDVSGVVLDDERIADAPTEALYGLWA